MRSMLGVDKGGGGARKHCGQGRTGVEFDFLHLVLHVHAVFGLVWGEVHVVFCDSV